MILLEDKTLLGRDDLPYAMFSSAGIKANKLSIKYLCTETPFPLKGTTTYYNDETGQRLAGRFFPLGWQLWATDRCRG
jgi:hypothetical protein